MSGRPKGFAPWSPRPETEAVLEQVNSVLEAYRQKGLLPLTVRQLFYRLVGAFGYSKTEKAYKRLADYIVRARRAGVVSFYAIRDDGTASFGGGGFSGPEDVVDEVRYIVQEYRLDRQAGQDRRVELWCEAAGMAPQLASAVREWSVPVYSSGGFDSLTVKWEAFGRFNGSRVLVLHVGDLDPSGVSIFESAAEDVQAMLEDRGWPAQRAEFQRLAVTEEQVDLFGLPTAPAKATDSRSANWRGGTVQAEALDPSDLRNIVRDAVDAEFDHDVLAELLKREEEERDALLSRVDSWLEGEE